MAKFPIISENYVTIYHSCGQQSRAVKSVESGALEFQLCSSPLAGPSAGHLPLNAQCPLYEEDGHSTYLIGGGLVSRAGAAVAPYHKWASHNRKSSSHRAGAKTLKSGSGPSWGPEDMSAPCLRPNW